MILASLEEISQICKKLVLKKLCKVHEIKSVQNVQLDTRILKEHCHERGGGRSGEKGRSGAVWGRGGRRGGEKRRRGGEGVGRKGEGGEEGGGEGELGEEGEGGLRRLESVSCQHMKLIS